VQLFENIPLTESFHNFLLAIESRACSDAAVENWLVHVWLGLQSVYKHTQRCYTKMVWLINTCVVQINIPFS